MSEDIDGGILYGGGLFFKNKLIVSVSQYNLVLNGIHHIYQEGHQYNVPPFEPGKTIFKPTLDMTKFNFTILF